MKKRTIYVVGSQKHYANWMQGEVVEKMHNADVVLFTGGADVNPKLYNRTRHPETYFDERRDAEEEREFNFAMFLGKPMVGVCRGAQFLCVKASGQLIQHQEDPIPWHEITTWDGRKFTMNSLHHQAQFPYALRPKEYRIIAWTKNISKYHHGHNETTELMYDLMPAYGREVEIAYYPKVHSLCIQGHPEMMYSKAWLNSAVSLSVGYCQELLNQLINNKLENIPV